MRSLDGHGFAALVQSVLDGGTDEEDIAREFAVPTATVLRWRAGRGLPREEDRAGIAERLERMA